MNTAIERALDDRDAPGTAQANQARLADLARDKQYKAGALRLHYKGVRDAGGGTSGVLLGPPLDPAAVPLASAAAQVEDLAREEAYAALLAKYGAAVRQKSTVYVREQRVVAARHKLYFLTSAGTWEKKFDHLQDGARGPINRSEVADLQRRIIALGPDSAALPEHTPIAPASVAPPPSR